MTQPSTLRHDSGLVRVGTVDGSEQDLALHQHQTMSLWVRLLESHNLMLGEIRRKLAGTCTMPRFDLLANLDREDGQTLASLSRRMLVTAGNLTGLVDRAERDGVVERRADPRDRRLSRIYLTEKGRELITGLLPKHAEHIESLLEGLDENDTRALRHILGKLRDSLGKKLLDGQWPEPLA
jgi:DNA-binding MarR family transcriptional regulator